MFCCEAGTSSSPCPTCSEYLPSCPGQPDGGGSIPGGPLQRGWEVSILALLDRKGGGWLNLPLQAGLGLVVFTWAYKSKQRQKLPIWLPKHF